MTSENYLEEGFLKEDNSQKKGLAIIYDPHNLYQFIWYYCNEGKDGEWDALCLPNGYKGEYMHSYCENAGVFKHIYKDDTNYSILPVSKKITEFLGMFAYFAIGRRHACCRKIINRFVNEKEYDEIVIIADVGLVSGACCSLGKEKEIIILEDGIGDYSTRKKWIPRGRLLSPYNWEGWMLSKMGYCSPGWYELKPDKNCIKYSSHPEKMKYRNYKEIRRLYEENGTDLELLRQIEKKLYPDIGKYSLEDVDAIILTRPLKDYVDDDEKYVKRLEEYINDHYKSVLVKRHPRDNTSYQFDSNVQSIEINNEIPAEVLLPYFKGKEVVVVSTSAVMLYTDVYGIHCKVAFFKGMHEENDQSNASYQFPTYDETDRFCKTYLNDRYEIIQL